MRANLTNFPPSRTISLKDILLVTIYDEGPAVGHSQPYVYTIQQVTWKTFTVLKVTGAWRWPVTSIYFPGSV